MCLTILINALEIRFFFSTVHIILKMNVIVTGTWYISEKKRGHELLQSFLWYCNITAQLPLHLFIYHISCTYCLTDKKDHMFYPMFNKFQHRDFFHSSKNRCSSHRVYWRYSSIFYTIYILHGTLDYLDISLSVLQRFHFYRSLDSLGIIKKHRCIFVQMGMYLI